MSNPARAAALLLSFLLADAAAALSPPESAVVTSDVQRFMQHVAQDVTAKGPLAWRTYFADSSAFFMVVNGKMQFADSAAATAGIAALPAVIQHIELTWGKDLRVDPLTSDYAVVATSYTETLVSPGGERHHDAGFFTGIAERVGGEWRLRDAHWSTAAPQMR